MSSHLHPASERQIRAAHPDQSTWVSANAGSGKTRVLTNRVARLLLQGVDPGRILCLTYTKAAAGEMQNRLFRRLGAWAMLDDASLYRELDALGEAAPSDLEEARSLFARAIDTPGGLKIQTIHAFCGSVLRRFPVEAQVSPQFQELDDRRQDDLMAEVLDRFAEGDMAPLLARFAQRCSVGDGYSGLRAILSNRAEFEGGTTRVAILRALGLPEEFSTADLPAMAFRPSDKALIQAILPVLAQQTKTYSRIGDVLAQINWDGPTLSDFQSAAGIFLYASAAKDGSHEAFDSKSRNFPQSNHTKAVEALNPWISDLHALMDRVAEAKQAELALEATQDAEALHAFASAFLDAYDTAKTARGWLDFDDLVLKTAALLADPSVAAWVQYRLDGGIDHILLDEAQDTSPTQWQVIQRLTGEFGAGEGAQTDRQRTVFVVGDPKQSIYSFQGANAQSFGQMKRAFQDQLRPTTGLTALELEYSFRSSPAVLRVVDEVLPDDMRMTQHLAFNDGLAGRVDLWPVVPKPDTPADTAWHDPVDRVAPNHESAELSRMIATEIRSWLASGKTRPTNDGPRVITEGDILILVRGREGRGDLFQNLIQALKAEGLAVAGADRFRIADELAVKDLLSLLKFLALPEDDLSLAEALRSPLFGLSEADLFDLASGREDSFLWPRLRAEKERFSPALDTIYDLMGVSDLLRPFEMIERILVRHDGRRKLLARLGTEAGDAIDEFLNQALIYESDGVPSLTGFVAWFEAGDVEVKRQHGTKPREIRVMTVHGAKGLEAPFVILPDTMRDPARDRNQIVPLADGPALWRRSRAVAPRVQREAQDKSKAADAAEILRLMYVAMTRAETWLIICGAGDPPKAGTWYQRIEQAFDRLEAVDHLTPAGTGRRFGLGAWDDAPGDAGGGGAQERTALPDWVYHPAPGPDKAALSLSPSDLGGAKTLPGEDQGDPAALARGSLIHRCLEVLPNVAADTRMSAANSLAAEAGFDAEAPDARNAIDEALAVLKTDKLEWVFAPDSLAEVEVSAPLPEFSDARIFGAIDRLIVSDDTVKIVDFKSNSRVPATPDEVPEGLLRQMGAYAAAVAQIYPNHRIEPHILWTATPEIMSLSHEVVREALQRATIS